MINSAKVYWCDNYDFACEKLLPFLSEKRLEKYNRLRSGKDKMNCAGTYMLLLRGLRDAGVEENELVYTDSGKPYIRGNPVFFNLSHTENGFACAVDSKEIGVDIQKIVTPRELMLKKFCTDKERRIVADSSEDFTKLWTLKESIIKKKGESIARYGSYEFDSLDSDFYAYGCHFMTVREEDKIISVCGEFEKIEFIKVKPTEL